MLVSIPIANLISGVSQQPPSLRVATAAEEQVNAWPSVITGLNKRPATQHLANTGWSISGSAAGHVIDRGTGYQFIVVVADGDLKVFNMNGVEQPVAFPDGKTYLAQAANPVDSFRFLTFGDTTFILNRDVSVVGDNFGEEGTTSYTPTATVSTFTAIPTANISREGQVYKVSDTGKYYKCMLIPEVPAVYAWDYVGPDDGAGSYVTYFETLPEPAAGMGTIRLGVFDGENYSYTLYTVIQTVEAQEAYYAWVEVTLASLVVGMGGRKNPAGYATVHITNSISNSFYSIYLNDNLVASFLTNKGVNETTSLESTTVIAQNLASVLATAQGGATAVNTEAGSTTYPARSALTVQRIGSTISISGLDEDDKITVTSTNGDKCIKCYRDQVPSFSDLPPNEVEGRVVMVKGSPKENGDDYFVVFQGDVWVETYGYGQGAGLARNTMPHVLVRGALGDWTFKKHTWGKRGAGDSESNPHPSFVGDKLSDMFLYTNRLGFVSSSNVILSEANEFENFYRTTLATLVDSDPLDFAVLSAMDDALRHAIPFNKDILILADRSQHRFTYNQFVGPKNVQVQYTTSYNVAPNVKPINMGGSVYFVDDRPEYSYAKLWEYFPKPNLTGDEASEVTDPIPQYIKSGVKALAASTRVNVAAVYSDAVPDGLYFYKFYWAGDRRIQNAWGRWTFADCTKILWMEFSNNYLYLLMKRSNGVCLEKVRVEETMFDQSNGTAILLDRRCTPTVTYNSGLDISTITLPYSTTADIQVVASKLTGPVEDQFKEVLLDTTKTSGSTVIVEGDWTGCTLRAGVPYTFLYEFSPAFVRFPKGQGEVVSLDGRLQLRYMRLNFADTAYFKTEVIRPFRTDMKEFDGKIVDEPDAVLGSSSPQTGKFRIPILSDAGNCRIRLINDRPWANAFSSAEYEATYSPRNKRL